MMCSRFLPQDFDPEQSVAVIAGRGCYPILTVRQIQAAQVKVRLIAFEGETPDELFEAFPPQDRKRIKVGQVGSMLKALKAFRARYVIMAGQITPRRLFKGLHPDLKALALLASLKERNAETIFRALATEIEKIGILQLDARAFLDHEMADRGMMVQGRYRPSQETLEHGIRMAKAIAQLDVGQGVVVSRGTVLAVEAFEGTDPMLKRSGTFGAQETLFVKTVKPGQDTRFDVPVFGLKTLEVMREAGINAAALEADNTIILEKERVLAEAKKHKITLLGYE